MNGLLPKHLPVGQPHVRLDDAVDRRQGPYASDHSLSAMPNAACSGIHGGVAVQRPRTGLRARRAGRCSGTCL
jgi:hypothetical protein